MPSGPSGSNAAPIIIKRKKVVKGGGHHGGAWKVAIFSGSFFEDAFAPGCARIGLRTSF